MINEPLVTIGILNYNGASFLRDTLPELEKLSYRNLEIIYLDNASTDNSLEILSSFPEVKIIRNASNQGYGAGKNLLVSHAHGEYILLLDNDIRLCDADVVQKLLSYYLSEKNIAFLSVPLIDTGRTATEHYGLFYSSKKRDIEYEVLRAKSSYIAGGFVGGFVFFRKDIFVKLGAYDTVYPFNLDDYDLSARAWLSGKKIHILSSTYADHLGISTRINIDTWSWKNSFYFSGFSRMIFKNYRFMNLLFWWPAASFLIFYKSAKRTVQYRSFLPIKSFFVSVGYFFRDIRETLQMRRSIQSSRAIQQDVFLRVHP